MRRVASAAFAALAVLASLTLAPATSASALTGSQFQPGNIISDAAFYDSTALSASGIQTFLNQERSANCGSNCVSTIKVTTPNETAEAGLCNGYKGAAGESAAAIFAKIAISCGVNPESLLVTAQKESGLITTSSPNYTTTMGYGCPDSTGCASKYYGFFNQVYLAARQFKLYRLHPTNYGYVAGENNFILYNPKSSCGGSTVFIQNQATAGLYDYTPYQPNKSALANLHGTGDSCGAYGNRNFWVYFNTWFPAELGINPNAPYNSGGLITTEPDGSMVAWHNTVNVTAPFPTSSSTDISVPGTWSPYNILITGDVNGDGLADVLATKSDGSLWLAINTGGALPYGGTVQVGPPGTWTGYTRFVTADVNGDGHSDLLATKSDGSMWLATSNGSTTAPFGAAVQISSPGAWTNFATIVAGDISGDGKTDIVATRPDGSLFYFPDSGSPTTPYLADRQIDPAGTYSNATAIVAVDINTDGRDDLVAVSTDGTLSVRYNSGLFSPVFHAAATIGSGWDDNDQIMSMSVQVPRRSVAQTIVAAKPAGGLYGTPNVPRPSPFPSGSLGWASGWQQYQQVALGDVTGDGPADLIATDSTGKMWLYRGTGKNPGPFTTRVQISAGFTGWRNLMLVNANSDRRADLLATIPDGSLWLFLNTGSATKPFALDAAHKIRIEPPGWNQYTAMAAVDLNQNGRLDLMVVTQAGALQTFYGNGSTTAPFGAPATTFASGWQNVTQLVAAGSTTVAAAPANVIATRSDGTMWFYRNNGDAHVPLNDGIQVLPSGWSAYSRLLAGNVTAHGLTDLVAIKPTGALWIYQQHSLDLFGSQSLLEPGWTVFNRIVVGDVNADGRPDIIATTTSGQLWYYPASTTSPVPYPAGYLQNGAGSAWQGYTHIMLADLTGDGRADIVATKASGQTYLYPAGTTVTHPFTTSRQIGSGWQNYRLVAAGDVNGDGLADVVAVKTDGTLWRLRNVHNPKLPLGTAVQIGTGFGAYNRIELGDIEGIGRADLIATKSDGSLWVCHNIANSATPFTGCIRSTTTNWSQFNLFGL